jgi:hypothetical protein
LVCKLFVTVAELSVASELELKVVVVVAANVELPATIKEDKVAKLLLDNVLVDVAANVEIPETLKEANEAKPVLEIVVNPPFPPTVKPFVTEALFKVATDDVDKVVAETPARLLKPEADCVFVCKFPVIVAEASVASPLALKILVLVDASVEVPVTLKEANDASPVLDNVAKPALPPTVKPLVTTALFKVAVPLLLRVVTVTPAKTLAPVPIIVFVLRLLVTVAE